MPVLLALLVGQRVANHLAQLGFLHLEERQESDLELFDEVTMVVQWSAGYASKLASSNPMRSGIFLFPFQFLISSQTQLRKLSIRGFKNQIKLLK